MVALILKLTEENKRKLDELASRTGNTPDELLNRAIEQFASRSSASSAQQDWRSGWRQAAGMWKNRDDLPTLMSDIRSEWDRT